MPTLIIGVSLAEKILELCFQTWVLLVANLNEDVLLSRKFKITCITCIAFLLESAVLEV